ncbi:MAG: hypothetical protein KAW92_04665 [Candidatus Cloacimonetes bacterium]|nr:hypothetical protein [Candidatus Cloacimonadota bacterium]
MSKIITLKGHILHIRKRYIIFILIISFGIVGKVSAISGSYYIYLADAFGGDIPLIGKSGMRIMIEDNFFAFTIQTPPLRLSRKHRFQVGFGDEVSIGSNGLKKFYIDATDFLDFYYFPFQSYFNINSKIHLGTFFLNNLTTMAEIGFEFPIEKGKNNSWKRNSKFIGISFFYRKSHKLLNYIKHYYWFLESRGIFLYIKF